MHSTAGSLPGEWGRFQSMAYLNISQNKLTGTRSSSLGLPMHAYSRDGPCAAPACPRMIACVGALPPSYANISSMKELILTGNSFQGRSASLLLQLAVTPCSAQNFMPTVGSCMLRWECRCHTGLLPDAWGDLANLAILTLMNNNLTGRGLALHPHVHWSSV